MDRRSVASEMEASAAGMAAAGRRTLPPISHRGGAGVLAEVVTRVEGKIGSRCPALQLAALHLRKGPLSSGHLPARHMGPQGGIGASVLGLGDFGLPPAATSAPVAQHGDTRQRTEIAAAWRHAR